MASTVANAVLEGKQGEAFVEEDEADAPAAEAAATESGSRLSRFAMEI